MYDQVAQPGLEMHRICGRHPSSRCLARLAEESQGSQAACRRRNGDTVQYVMQYFCAWIGARHETAGQPPALLSTHLLFKGARRQHHHGMSVVHRQSATRKVDSLLNSAIIT
jgi:hypothetical protein